MIRDAIFIIKTTAYQWYNTWILLKRVLSAYFEVFTHLLVVSINKTYLIRERESLFDISQLKWENSPFDKRILRAR